MTRATAAAYTQRMLRGLLLLAACSVLAGCGAEREAVTTAPAQPPPESAGMCMFVVEFDGHDYVGANVETTPQVGSPLGEGTIPPCNDTPDGVEDPEDAQVVAVSSIKGVSPDIAIMLPEDGSVLIREGAPELPEALKRR